jgi:hypothetical protein
VPCRYCLCHTAHCSLTVGTPPPPPAAMTTGWLRRSSMTRWSRRGAHASKRSKTARCVPLIPVFPRAPLPADARSCDWQADHSKCADCKTFCHALYLLPLMRDGRNLFDVRLKKCLKQVGVVCVASCRLPSGPHRRPASSAPPLSTFVCCYELAVALSSK